MPRERVCVTGAGGFIGGHLCKRLKAEGYTVIGVDWKRHEFFAESGVQWPDSLGIGPVLPLCTGSCILRVS